MEYKHKMISLVIAKNLAEFLLHPGPGPAKLTHSDKNKKKIISSSKLTFYIQKSQNNFPLNVLSSSGF